MKRSRKYSASWGTYHTEPDHIDCPPVPAGGRKEKWMKERTEEIKKIECSVCGRKFTPRKEHKYKASEYITEGGLGNAVSGATERRQYDCFD